jgi:transcriptional repressor NrdR
LACGFRFTTHERIEIRLPLVVKKDGGREPFNRDKLVAGLSLACRKRPVSAEQLEAIADRVIAMLGLTSGEITSSDIGGAVLEELSELDVVAYVRFASVYLEIDSPGELVELLEPWVDRRVRRRRKSSPKS